MQSIEDHARDHCPEWVLLVQHMDDTCDVICHWHERPPIDEVQDMIADVRQGTSPNPQTILRFFLTTINDRMALTKCDKMPH